MPMILQLNWSNSSDGNFLMIFIVDAVKNFRGLQIHTFSSFIPSYATFTDLFAINSRSHDHQRPRDPEAKTIYDFVKCIGFGNL